jgi:hypothetical protein
MSIEQLKNKYKKMLDNSNSKLAERHNDYVCAFQMAYEEILKDLNDIKAN